MKLFIALLFPLICFAAPTGERVVRGSCTVERNGAETVIRQHSDRAIMEWRDFSIESGERVRIAQIGERSAILHRVTGSVRSRILGHLEANGRVYLLNRNGILIGPNGSVVARGFVASTLHLSDESFWSGGLHHFGGDSEAAIRVEGRLEGRVYLIARHIEHRGAIVGDEVVLAAGSEVWACPEGEGRVAIKVMGEGTLDVAAAEIRAVGGDPYRLAMNTDGWIYMAGDEVTLDAHSHLKAGEGGTIAIQGESRVEVAGSLEAPKGWVEISTQGAIEYSGCASTREGLFLLQAPDIAVGENLTATFAQSEVRLEALQTLSVPEEVSWTSPFGLMLSAPCVETAAALVNRGSGAIAISGETVALAALQAERIEVTGNCVQFQGVVTAQEMLFQPIAPEAPIRITQSVLDQLCVQRLTVGRVNGTHVIELEELSFAGELCVRGQTLVGPLCGSHWQLTGVNAGRVGPVEFQGISCLVGRCGNDVFEFLPGGAVTGSIVGGEGRNCFDYREYGAIVTVDLDKGSATGCPHFVQIQDFVVQEEGSTLKGASRDNFWALEEGGKGTLNDEVSFVGFTHLVGGEGENTLKGPDVATLWTIEAEDAGSVAGISFVGMQSLQGGDDVDVFAFYANLTGSLSGGGGENWIVGEAFVGGAIRQIAGYKYGVPIPYPYKASVPTLTFNVSSVPRPPELPHEEVEK